MIALAALGALLIGVCLGLLGSGGSILTVPVLTYLVGQEPKVAIAGSLGVVSFVSLVGAVPYMLRREVAWSKVLLFGGPGMVGTWTGAFLSKSLSGIVQLTGFAAVMMFAAFFMLRNGKGAAQTTSASRPSWWIVVAGLLVGVLTGLVGVGGGFLIVPALVLLGGMPMRLAVGTSLLIIAMQSASGFVKYQDVLRDQGFALDWGVLAVISGIGAVGTFAGSYLSQRMPQQILRRIFGLLLTCMAAFMLWRTHVA